MFLAWAASLTSCANWRGCDASTIPLALLTAWAVPVPAMQAILVRRWLPRHGMHPGSGSGRSHAQYVPYRPAGPVRSAEYIALGPDA